MEIDGIRRRVQRSQSNSESTKLLRPYRDQIDPKLGLFSWCFIFIYVWTVIIVSRYISSYLPPPWPSSDHGDTRDTSKFSEDRAVQHLLVLTSFRPRTVGTDGNDKFAVKYIIKEAEMIKRKAEKVHDIEIDHQIVSGSFRLAFLGGINSVYQDIHNVLVRIGPVNSSTNRTLMINCHFDAAIGVDGASDDLSQCVAMLEVLMVLSHRGSLPCKVLFMFNGAEESILQASHGFVTQHPWADDVAAFINLEAAGSGGRDALFQTGPKHPWLVRAYSKVPFPCGNVFGEEIFQSGVIPSDTDFRIFRDYGQIPGVDIAYVENGYVYHTHYDRVEQITPGTLQRSGENLLAMIYGVLASPEFHKLGSCEECAKDSAVYYDVLGLFFVMYSHRVGTIVNYFFAVTAFLAVLLEIKREFTEAGELVPDLPRSRILLIGILTVISCFLLPVAFSGVLGYVISCVAPMSWYSRPLIAFLLYGSPTVAMVFWIQQKLFSYRDMVCVPTAVKEGTIYHLVAVVWILGLVLLTWKGLNSAFLLLFFVAAPVPIRFIWLHMQPLTRRELVAFLTAHLVAVFIPTVFGLYNFSNLVEVFTPIFGRSGSETNPDVALAVLISFITVSVGSYYTSLIQITESRVCSLIVKVASAVCLVTVLVITFTSVGFPYSAPPGRIAPKRLTLQHFHREIYDMDGTKLKSDNALWVVPLDYLGVSVGPMEEILNISTAKPLDAELLYYGLPFIYPMMDMIRHYKVVPVKEAPVIPFQPTLTKLREDVLRDGYRRLFFSVQLVDHSNIFISPRPHCTIHGWNLTNAPPMEGPKHKDQTTYFVFLVAGYNVGKPSYQKLFWLEIECNEETSGNLPHSMGRGSLEIGVVNHFLSMTSPLVDSVNSRLPSWINSINWLNSLHLYVF